MNRVSQQEINIRFHQMGVLLLLNSPQQLQFGIDNITWKIGNKFKGLKLIPLGTHIITYSLKNQNYMFPIKKFIHFGSTHKQVKDDQRIRVFKWCNKSERFMPVKGEEAQGYRNGVKKCHFDCYLGPYPQQNVQFWATNTKYITKEVLDKLDPIQYFQDFEEQYELKGKKIEDQQPNIDSQSDGQKEEGDDIQQEIQDLNLEQNIQQNNTQNKKQGKLSEDINEVKKSKDFGGNIYYSDIPRRLSQQASQISMVNIDRTQILQSIIKSDWIKNQYGILGELQYSFISFLIGQCLDSYNQWKHLMILLCSSQKAFQTHKNLMLDFIVVFYQQIKQFPSDFFYDQLAKDNFLAGCLKNLKFYQTQRNINKKALSRIGKLLEYISQKFKYEVQDEQDEQPVVVDQNESYF